MVGIINLAYLLSAIGFIGGIKLMAAPSSARNGNILSAIAMTIAIVATTVLVVIQEGQLNNIYLLAALLLVGTIIGKGLSESYEMTRMPELISLFNAFGGLCALIIGINESFITSLTVDQSGIKVILLLGVFLGGASFSGSIIAFYKLAGKMKTNFRSKALTALSWIIVLALPAWHIIQPEAALSFQSISMIIGAISLLYGILFAMPVGGADMPVLISVLNAVTGIATAISGILFDSTIMLLGGILVGSTGILLTIQMCKAMNRSLKKVLLGQTATSVKSSGKGEAEQEIQTISTAETASILAFSKNVAIIPGFGMAVSQAQKECFELQKRLEGLGANVKYIIHPVAGRMPGHMNVLLAEANIDYNDIVEMEEVNHNMAQFDAAIIIGANDVVNPAAETDADSVVYGMPIIKAYQAKQVIVMKRGMSAGYSGASNPLFERANCKLLFGDAKHSLNKIIEEVKMI
jgi:NAD(P) transhydrogenase subunit beta